MVQTEDELKQELLASDPEFKALYDDHRSAKQRLRELAQKSFLSEEDELEIKQLKRRKLFLKDRMAAILRDRQPSQVPAGG